MTPIKPCLNFLSGLWLICIDWGRPRTLVNIINGITEQLRKWFSTWVWKFVKKTVGWSRRRTMVWSYLGRGASWWRWVGGLGVVTERSCPERWPQRLRQWEGRGQNRAVPDNLRTPKPQGALLWCQVVESTWTCISRKCGISPGWGRSPEKELATHSSILAWRIPWTEEPGGYSLRGRKRQTGPSTHSTQEPQGDGRPIINTMCLQVFQQHSPKFRSTGTSWKWGLRKCSRGKEREESTPDLGHTCSHAKSLQSCPALCDPVDWSLRGSLSMGFSSQEYRSGLPCPPPGDLLNTGIEPTLLMSPKLAGGFFNASWIWWGTLNLVRVSS